MVVSVEKLAILKSKTQATFHWWGSADYVALGLTMNN
jgi:hypothetical protein